MLGERSPFGYTMSRVLILDKVREELGLDRIQKLFYVAAPLKKATSVFFASLNMPVTSIFGLTETSGAITYQEFPNVKLGYDGQAIPGTDIKIFNPDPDGVGEICIRGRNVFMGYLKRDDENQEAFDVEGYFHTGDIGYLDKRSENRLRVTGRIKDTIITAGGENISPTPIEHMFKSICPIVSHCVLIGDDKKYLSLIMTLKVQVDFHSKPTFELDPNLQSMIFRKYAINENLSTIAQAQRSKAVNEYI